MLEAAGLNGFTVPCRTGGVTSFTGEEQLASDVCNWSWVCASIREGLLSGDV